VYVRPVDGTVTLIAPAPRMTWLFVSTVPEEVSTIPVAVPAPPPYASRVSTITTPVVAAVGAASVAEELAPSTTASTTIESVMGLATALKESSRG
jgi:hypothetical protein